MPNFFLDNKDILLHFNSLFNGDNDMRNVVAIAEDNYAQAKEFRDAPINYEDAVENYKKVLEVVGDLAADVVQKLVMIQIPALLLPFLRPAVASLLLNAGFPGVVFPLINVHALAADASKRLSIREVEPIQQPPSPPAAK